MGAGEGHHSRVVTRAQDREEQADIVAQVPLTEIERGETDKGKGILVEGYQVTMGDREAGCADSRLEVVDKEHAIGYVPLLQPGAAPAMAVIQQQGV